MRNQYRVVGDETIIYINRRNGDVFEVLIDTEDLPKLLELGGSWCVDLPYGRSDRRPYAIRNTTRGEKRYYEKMHRLLTDAETQLVVDHINGSTLDNRKNNLRVTNQFINQQNRKKPNRNSKTGIKNIHWDRHRNKWIASVMIDGKVHRKRYNDKTEAIKAVEMVRNGEWSA